MQSMRSWESITYIYNMDLKKKHVEMLWMATLTIAFVLAYIEKLWQQIWNSVGGLAQERSAHQQH